MPTRVSVNPGTTNPTHSVSISDGSTTWGLILVDGAKSIQETPMTPSTLLVNSQGKRYGDYDPAMSHIEQADWSGGRGGELFTSDETMYFDNRNQWTLVKEATFPTLQWKYASGYRSMDMNQPGAVYNWKPLIGTTYSISFTASATYSADKAYVWIRRIGTPGELTVELRSDSSGAPGAVLKSASVSTSIVTDTMVELVKFDWDGTQAITSGTTYHLVVYGSATDTAAAHWEAMTGMGGSGQGYTSSNRTAWSTTTAQLYFRVTDADTSRSWKLFPYQGKMTAVDIKASGTSQVYTATDAAFSEVSTTGLGTVTDVLVNNGTVYFAQGESTNIRRWNGSAFSDDGTNKATFLYGFVDASGLPVVWRANTSSSTANISKASSAAWGTSLTFGTAVNLGDSTYPITGMADYNSALWVFKQDSVWSVSAASVPSKLSIGIDDMPSAANGAASTAHGLFLIFSFLGSVERLYSTTLDDIGPGRGAGLPSGRQGYAAAFESVISTLFVAMDAGTSGTSSVLAYDGINYHEIFRAPEVGQRIRALRWQPGTQSTRPKLWIECGGDIIYMTFPLNTMNPLRDSGIYFAPEGSLVTATYDMGAARLPKLFKDLTAITRNLDGVARIGVDYQVDQEIDGSAWRTLGDFTESPADTLAIDEGKRVGIRFRFRFLPNNALLPPVMKASVLEGIARTPVKYQWVMRVKASSIQSTFSGAPDHNPDRLLAWLKEKAGNAEVLHMHSPLKALDGRIVMAEPPNTARDFYNSVLKFWGGQVVIVLREA